MDKEKEISKEISELWETFKDIPKEKHKMVEGLVQNAAFMKVTLLELQKEVIAKGAVIECQSGNGFDTIKDNPAQKAYTTMVSRYTQIIDQLNKMIPTGKAVAGEDEMLEFLRNR